MCLPLFESLITIPYARVHLSAEVSSESFGTAGEILHFAGNHDPLNSP